MLERKEARDIVGIYYAGNEWKMVNQLSLDTFDAQDIKWIHADSALLVWDTALESKILIHSAATGDVLTKFQPDVVGLGIKKLCVSNGAQHFIAAGLYDGSIVLYNNLTALEIASLQHVPRIDLNMKSAKSVFVYQEEVSHGVSVTGSQHFQYICY